MFIDWQTKFIGEAREQRKPFFLYMPFVGAHFPLMAPAEDVAKFKGRYMRGWEAVRRERFERQKKLGIIAAEDRKRVVEGQAVSVRVDPGGGRLIKRQKI